MRKILLFLVVGLLVPGLAVAKDYEVKKKAGPYDCVATIDKNPPVTGKNGLAVACKDGSGKAVTDAKVMVDYGMAAMPGMPAMNYKAGADLKGDRYASTLNFSMGGPWFVNVKISRGGKTETLKLNVDVQ